MYAVLITDRHTDPFIELYHSKERARQEARAYANRVIDQWRELEPEAVKRVEALNSEDYYCWSLEGGDYAVVMEVEVMDSPELSSGEPSA